MQRKERIPLHDHSDGNSGGRIGSSGLQSAVISTTTTTTTSGGAANLSELGDVNVITTPPADNDSLTYDSASGKWIPEAVTSTVAALDDVGDVNAPTPSDGDVLTWDSTPGEWVAAAPTGGGSVATDTIWDTKGDLAVGTGADTASKLAAGTDGYGLVARSGEATGLKWEARTLSIGLGVDGGGVVVTTGGPKYEVIVPCNCTVTLWDVSSIDGTSTTSTFDIKRRAYGGGAAASLIGAGTKPSVTAGTENQSAPASWTSTALVAGDRLQLFVDANNNGKLLAVTLTATRT